MTTITDLIVTPEVQAANRAAHDAKKAAARTRKAYDEALRLDRIRDAERAALEAAASAVSVVVETPVTTKAPVFKGVVVLADPAETDRIRAANAEADRIAAERKAAKKEAAKPISAEVLVAGLEADRAAEAKRASDEVARVALLAEGYKADIRRSANAINYSDKLSLQEKVTALLEIGFVHMSVAVGKSGRDAEYFHAKSGVKFFLKGAGLGTQEVVRPHKARGCELLPPMTAADHEARRLKKIAEKAAMKAGRAPKKSPTQIKKDEEKAKKTAANAAKAAKKRR